MPSLIAWLDATAEEQKAARELIAMFSEKESRDELGIGPIRDAFSDLLFPGTSVLQTRARYYLFIPWCYLASDVVRLSGQKYREKGRANERALIKVLRASESADMTGLIGARSGVNVVNLPSDIYWNGMIKYGVRSTSAAIGSIVRSDGATDGATELTERGAVEWSLLPPAPPGFPELSDANFAMQREEAMWLKERMSIATEGTLLAHLLERGDLLGEDVTAPWLAGAESQFEELRHARLFSAVMQGAALLYNLLIAERFAHFGLETGDEDNVSHYRERLAMWHEDLRTANGAGLATWDLDEMWDIVKRANPNIHQRTQEFVGRWVTQLRGTSQIADHDDLRKLVGERERRKGAQSRLKNEKMLAGWSRASGTSRLTYRWGTVKVIVNDIVRGLDDARA